MTMLTGRVTAALADLFHRRREAEAALEDPAVLRAFAAVRERALGDFQNSRPEDAATRERAYHTLAALRGIEHELARQISAHQIEAYREDGSSGP